MTEPTTLRTKAGSDLFGALIAMTGNRDSRTYFVQVAAIEQQAAAAERERIRELVLAASTLVLPTGVYIDREALLDDLDPETP